VLLGVYLECVGGLDVRGVQIQWAHGMNVMVAE